MSSATYLVESAARRIGVHSDISPIEPEGVSQGRDILVSWLEEQRSRNIDMGTVPVFQAGEEVGEPLDARNAIIANLALELAALWDRPVSTSLAGSARRGMIFIEDKYQVHEIPGKVPSSTLIVGEGNARGSQSRIFFGRDRELG